jgi:hypothetical protein
MQIMLLSFNTSLFTEDQREFYTRANLKCLENSDYHSYVNFIYVALILNKEG